MKARAPAEAARTFASLCPTLLARKGGARPAMRSQLQADRFGDSLPRAADSDSDLGWNDFGDGVPAEPVPAPQHTARQADVVPIGRDAADPAYAAVPTVVRQRKAAEQRIAAEARGGESRGDELRRDRTKPASRRSALDAGRKAAFTLRLDAERHLKLRLACTVDARSAQQVVTEALDRLLDQMPDIAALADRVSQRSKS